MPLIVKCNNGTVTDTYLEIIGEALENIYDKVLYTNDIREAYKEDKNCLIVVARTVDGFKLLRRGYTNVMVWFQGVEPEESYMTHHSRIRYFILSYFEKYILKKCVFSFFVSDAMKSHYEKKYRISINKEKYYCMPCLNTQIHKEAFFDENKYKKNIFAYIGSLAVWQKFSETVRLYKLIEDSGVPECSLRVFTSEQEDAKRILDNYRVNNYSISFVNNSELANALKDVKYGFIIREDTTVNRVATPTKISTYLSCGMIPIYSECLEDFARFAETMIYAVKADENIIDKIKLLANKEISNSEVFREYQRLFESHYNREVHVRNIISKLGK